MADIQTRYGLLHGVTQISYASSGTLESLWVNEPNIMPLSMASLVPLHHVEDNGRRRETPILFHPNGGLKSLPLQGSANLLTSIGIISAELVTFYDTGEVRRIFPTAGKLSGFWTEDQEYELAPKFDLNWNGTQFTAKVINAHFYRSGELQSITFWPKERVLILVNDAVLKVRSGISFYRNGLIKSYEPAEPTLVNTAIGSIVAYDNDPLGVSSDVNSLQFDLEGEVVAVKTLSTRVRVFPAQEMPLEFSAHKAKSFCEETDAEFKPLEIAIRDGLVHIKGESAHSFPLKSTQFETALAPVRVPNTRCSS